jgi:Tol biopolymer transport system component
MPKCAIKKQKFLALIAVLLWFQILPSLSFAKKKYVITIDKFSEKKVPIAIVPFLDRSDPPFRHVDWNSLAAIISKDLTLTGWFDVIKPEAFLDLSKEDAGVLDVGAIPFQKWAAIDADYLVKGYYEAKGSTATGKMVLYDVVGRKELRVFPFKSGNPNESGRKTAHQISNYIVEEITGELGIFETYIAGTIKKNVKSSAKEIFVCDFDGGRMRSITDSNAIN